MPYATPTDLIARYGEAELARLTTPEGQDLAGVDVAKLARELAVAEGLVNSYLRTRYAVPLVVVPVEIGDACMVLARYTLSFGENREPAEQTRLARRDTLAWLEGIAAGRVTLNGAVPAGSESGAMASDRPAAFTGASLRDW